ncbi:MAG TPA: sigma-54 dependent transcriptional regulator [Chitinophagales bacterium]|nr:sigma-54 dependent transcriptional regulator [Chitinophagales bacterium]
MSNSIFEKKSLNGLLPPPAAGTERHYITKIFMLEDNSAYATQIKYILEKENNYDITVFETATEFFKHLRENPDIVIIDYFLPDRNGIDVLKEIQNYNRDIACIILSGQDEVEVVVDCYKNGAKDYIIKDNNAHIELKKSIQNWTLNANLRKEVAVLNDQIIDRNKYTHIIGESKALLKVLRLMQKVEKTNMQVLISGQSGTGKELVSAAIHYNSPRARKPYVTVNVAAIPDDLMESELFGHEKGAFTGADSKRIGKFEEANEGTIFLDEIGEMDFNLQTKLLRVLQENKVTRLGSNKEIPLNVRVIAASNKNLAQRVKDGKMREDLYYRLQGFLIHLPTLRERDNDVLLLAKHFLSDFCEKNHMGHKSFSPEALRQMMTHRWTGNVRELKSMVERTALISDHYYIMCEDLIFSQDIFSEESLAVA